MVQPVDSYGQVPLLVIVASQDEVRVGEILLVDIGPEDALGTLRPTSVSVVVVNVEPTPSRAVPVGLHHKPTCIPSDLDVAAVGVDDLRHPVNGRDHHALLDVRFVVALRNKLDDIGILR